ncbi:hypothetical protein DEU56DRAFT_756361 [Suillus clintonianus]|uniref:uncharacterized protein n=1 Tax=Suillus clintonianus TaxID=1904413 RepID=UPI001B86E964|nr:uncharacterized protein DEU56DRAFT_756361 [Suillus clintonianus]KAG2136458.1 hypothetical protein DEU56DRAFT_756361 [Suillus clintonianus]
MSSTSNLTDMDIVALKSKIQEHCDGMRRLIDTAPAERYDALYEEEEDWCRRWTELFSALIGCLNLARKTTLPLDLTVGERGLCAQAMHKHQAFQRKIREITNAAARQADADAAALPPQEEVVEPADTRCIIVQRKKEIPIPVDSVTDGSTTSVPKTVRKVKLIVKKLTTDPNIHQEVKPGPCDRCAKADRPCEPNTAGIACAACKRLKARCSLVVAADPLSEENIKAKATPTPAPAAPTAAGHSRKLIPYVLLPSSRSLFNNGRKRKMAEIEEEEESESEEEDAFLAGRIQALPGYISIVETALAALKKEYYACETAPFGDRSSEDHFSITFNHPAVRLRLPLGTAASVENGCQVPAYDAAPVEDRSGQVHAPVKRLPLGTAPIKHTGQAPTSWTAHLHGQLAKEVKITDRRGPPWEPSHRWVLNNCPSQKRSPLGAVRLRLPLGTAASVENGCQAHAYNAAPIEDRSGQAHAPVKRLPLGTAPIKHTGQAPTSGTAHHTPIVHYTDGSQRKSRSLTGAVPHGSRLIDAVPHGSRRLTGACAWCGPQLGPSHRLRLPLGTASVKNGCQSTDLQDGYQWGPLLWWTIVKHPPVRRLPLGTAPINPDGSQRKSRSLTGAVPQEAAASQVHVHPLVLLKSDLPQAGHFIDAASEVIGCVFNLTPDEAARQASGFVTGSSTFMDLINEHRVDTCLTLDWIITTAKAKKLPASTAAVYLVKPHWIITDVSGQSWCLRSLCRATQYYDAELKTEATNLLELQRKQGHSDKTLDDIIGWLDVTVSKIDIVPWPQDHIDQCENDDPKMFDIPLVTSTSHIVLCKLAHSEKFKYSVPKTLLEQYKKATSTTSTTSTSTNQPTSGSNVGPPSGERQHENTTCDSQPQQQTHRAARRFSVVHEDHHSNNDPSRTDHHPVVLQPQRMQPRKRLHVEDYDQTFESEAASLNAPDSCIRKKLKLVSRLYVMMVLRALSQLILILNLDIDLMHTPLAMSHLNTGIMRVTMAIPSSLGLDRGSMRSSASGWLKLNESYGIGSCTIKIIKVDFMENNNGDKDGKDN